MNRVLVFGVGLFLAMLSVALLQQEKSAYAGHRGGGCSGSSCCGCSGGGSYGCDGGCSGGCSGCYGCSGGCSGGSVCYGGGKHIQNGGGHIQNGHIQNGKGGSKDYDDGGDDSTEVPIPPETATSSSDSTFTSQSQLSGVRVWTDDTGMHQVEASFLSFADGKVKLRRASTGATMTVPLHKLSRADQQRVLRVANR